MTASRLPAGTQPPASHLVSSALPTLARVAVVIPAYRVSAQILRVIAGIGDTCDAIYVVDDACPENSGALVSSQCNDPRVTVLQNPVNLGVGGAVMAGYRAALDDGADVVVKIDGDGQMDPALLPLFIEPILAGEADYTKGNRFYNPEDVQAMPMARLLGNAALSLLNKFSSGYWDIFDPTNGYTAIGRKALSVLPLDKVSERYFFESDMLFRLGLSRAVVADIPMKSRYADETSSLKITQVVFEFLFKHVRNFFKRIAYLYYMRDFSIASIELLSGIALGAFGTLYGGINWYHNAGQGLATPAGTVVLSAVLLLASFQLLLSFLNFDINAVPRRPLSLSGLPRLDLPRVDLPRIDLPRVDLPRVDQSHLGVPHDTPPSKHGNNDAP